ncbi:unnamed protein product [Sphagnum jensenii]|uniref:CHAT domain-containing protein n=1 Tax=Sphagnum jensenii TaxID=128206 RepID=A0ABP0XBX2_9BRYO
MADAISAPDQACAGLLEQYEKFMACGKQLAAARCLESATPELQKRPCVALALAEARSLLGKYAAAEKALKSADKVKISLGERLRIASGLALLLVHTSPDQSEGIKQAQLRTAKALRCAELEPDLSSVDKAHIMVDRAKAILIAASRWQVDVQADLEFRGACDVLEDASSILKLHGAPRAAMTARFLLVDSKEKIDEQLTLMRTVAKDATDLGQIGIAFEARIRAARIRAACIMIGDRSFTAAKIVEELKDVQGASDEVWPIEASVERRLVGTDSSDLLQELASSVEELAEGGAVGPAWHLARRLADLAIDRKEHETATNYLQRAHSLAKDVGCQHLLAEMKLVRIRRLISMQKLAEAIGACDDLLRPGVVGISAEQRFRILTDAANALLATGQYEAGLERKTKARAALEAANNGGNLIFTRHRIAVDCEESNLEPLQELDKLLKLAADDIKQFLASSLQYQETVLDLERASSLQAQETEPYLERAEESLQKAKNMNIMKEEKSSANAGLWYSLTGTVIVCRLMKDFFDQALKDFLDQAQKNYNEATGVRKDHLDDAQKNYNEAIRCFTKAGYTSAHYIARNLINAATVILDYSNLVPSAVDRLVTLRQLVMSLQRAVEDCKTSGTTLDHAWSLVLLGSVQLALGTATATESPDSQMMISDGLKAFCDAEDVLDKVQQSVCHGSPLDRRNIKANLTICRARACRTALPVLLANKQWIEAWQLCQLAKSRTLADVIGSSSLVEDLKKSLSSDSMSVMQRELTVAKSVGESNAANWDVDSYQLAEAQAQLKAARSSDTNLQAYLDFVTGAPLKLSETIELARELGEEAVAFVDWFYCGDSLWISVVRLCRSSQDCHPEFRCLTKNDLESLVGLFANGGLYNWNEQSEQEELTNLLVHPDLAELTKPGDLLVLSPTSELYRVPFQALKVGEELLLKRNPCVYTPCLRILRQCTLRRKGSTPGQDFAGLVEEVSANSKTLAESAAEAIGTNGAFLVGLETVPKVVNEIATTLGLDAPQGTRENFMKAIGSYQVVLYLGHISFEPKNSLASSIILANERFSATDVFSLPAAIETRTLLLAGCESGRLRVDLGDEPSGLVSAFLFAGVNSVLVTLGTIDRNAAAFLLNKITTMLSKKENTCRAGAFARALQASMLALRESAPVKYWEEGGGEEGEDKDKWKKPYYWAPFVIYGLP